MGLFNRLLALLVPTIPLGATNDKYFAGSYSLTEKPDEDYVYLAKGSGGYYVEHDCGGNWIWSPVPCIHCHQYKTRQQVLNDYRTFKPIRIKKSDLVDCTKKP
jgi:hypothetical protein